MKTHDFPSVMRTGKNILLISLISLAAACSGSRAPSSGPVPDGHYRVRSGDTLYSIAKRHGQSVDNLAAWNQLGDRSKIEVGQVLRVRRNAASAGTPPRTAGERAVAPVNRLNMQWPVDSGAANVVQRYNGVSNKGVDIAGIRGQSIKAAAAGKVLYVGEGVRGYGKLILISHNHSTITAYAHNDTVLVQEGQSVGAGQAVATMGSSDTDSVKLHFEVRINGKAVDPMPYLPK